jgi:RloB-like protein
VVSRRRFDDRSIKRRASQSPPRRRILIVCEGEKTERGYFEAFQRDARNPRVSVEIANQTGEPLHVVRSAIKLKEQDEQRARRERDENLAWDEVWGVFDVDEHPRLGDAKVLAKKNGVRLAISNPCFELWALLHFQDQRAFIDRRRLIDQIKRHLPGYDKGLDYAKLRPGYEDARERARVLSREATRAADPDRNPTTGVPALTESIRTG